MWPAVVVVVKKSDSTKSESTKRRNVTNHIRVLVTFSIQFSFHSMHCTKNLFVGPVIEPVSSDEDEPLASNHLGHENAEDEGTFVFKRHKPCTYQKVSVSSDVSPR